MPTEHLAISLCNYHLNVSAFLIRLRQSNKFWLGELNQFMHLSMEISKSDIQIGTINCCPYHGMIQSMTPPPKCLIGSNFVSKGWQDCLVLWSYLESVDLVLQTIHIFMWNTLTGDLSLDLLKPFVQVIYIFCGLSKLLLDGLLK